MYVFVKKQLKEDRSEKTAGSQQPVVCSSILRDKTDVYLFNLSIVLLIMLNLNAET